MIVQRLWTTSIIWLKYLPGFQFIQDPLDYATVMSASIVSIRDTSGTDHLSFDAVGLTHLSDLDTYDHAVPEDLMQASAVIATAVYEAANRRELLPRRAPPKPQLR